MNFYLSAVDDLLKGEYDNPSIGLILCKEKDRFTTNYSIKDINKYVRVNSYEVNNIIPKEILE